MSGVCVGGVRWGQREMLIYLILKIIAHTYVVFSLSQTLCKHFTGIHPFDLKTTL